MLKTFTKTNPQPAYEITLIAIIAAVLRLFKLPSVSVWHNEGVSVAISQLPWGSFIDRLVHEPFGAAYYLLLKFWGGIFGFGIYSIRHLSLILGTLAAVAVYFLARRIFSETKVAFLAGILVALSPLQSQVSQSAQGQVLALLLALVSSVLLLKALEENSLKSWLWYGITAAAMLYSDIALLFVLAAQGAYTILRPKASRLLPLGAFTLILILCTPLLWLLPTHMQTVAIAIPSFWRAVDISWQSMFGGYGTNRVVEIIGLVIALFTLAFSYLKIKEPKRLLLTLLFAIGLISAWVLFPRIDSDMPVTLLVASGMLSIVFASAIMRVPNRTGRQVLVAAIIMFTIFMNQKNWAQLNVDAKPGMSAASEYVNDTARPQDYLFAANPRMFFSLRYYNETGIFTRLFAPGHENFPGEELLTADDTAADFSLPQSNDNAWVVWSRGFDGSKPVVPGNWELITEKFYPDAPDYKGQIVVSYYHVR